MRYLLCSLAAALGVATAAYGQQLQGLLTVAGETGYLTNAYLDPGLPVWDRSMRAPFVALSPALHLLWSTAQSEVELQGRIRHLRFAEDAAAWWAWQGQVHGQRSLSGRWRVGVDGIASAMHTGSHQSVLWAIPYVRYVPAPRMHVGVRAGTSCRRPGAGMEAEAGTFVLLETGFWPGSRWHGQGSLYYGQSAEAGTAGLGALLTTRYWFARGVQLAVQAGTDQYGPAAAPGGAVPQADRTWHTAASVDWPLGANGVFTARMGMLYHVRDVLLEQPYDLYVATGFRWLLRSTRPLRAEREPLWVQEDRQVRFRIPHRGRERLYLVGDFNGWEQPGILLEAGPGLLHTVVLTLEPGTYQYKVQVGEGNGRRWLSLPEHALTVQDGFGGANGLLIVN